MKHFLLGVMALLCTLCATAQGHDLSIALMQPRNYFVSGVQFTFEVQFKNNGPNTIPAGDSIIYQPTFNGQPLLEMGNPVSFRHVLSNNLSPLDTVNVSRQMTIIGGSIGQVVVCAEIIAHRGAAQGNETDSSNWQNCWMVDYTDNASTGSFRLMTMDNRSRINGNTLTVDVEGVPHAEGDFAIRFCDIQGKTLLHRNAVPTKNHLFMEYELPPLPSGVYLLHITNNREVNATKKLVIY